MKKRLLSALLALALVFVLLPTTALAGETTYSDSEITISGKYWNFGNKGTSGEYAPVYFRSNGTAFQESKPTGSNYLEIKKTGEKEITITVYGTVNLTENESSTNSCISVNSNGVNERNLIITGAAKGSTLNLTCKNNSHPLYSYEGSITINGGVTVNATSQYSNNNNNASVYGIQVSNRHDLTISGTNTKVNVVNKTYDSTVKVNGNITVSDGAQLKAENKSGKVTGYTSKKAYAIECGGKLSISGDKTQVTAKTSNGKQAISGTVSNGDKLTFKVQLYLASSTLDQKPMDEALGYKYVEITQAPTDPYVFIAGEPAIMGQETPIPGGSGTYLYVDAGYDGNILTLKDATINKTDSIKAVQAIRFGQNGYYTIKLEGENKISGFSSGIVAPNDSGVNNVTVVLSGSGSLDISANQYAIDMQVGKLKFENTGKIMLTTGYTYPASTLNALHVAGNVTIDKTKYDIVGVKQDIEGTRENISDNPNLDTILKGTDSTLYFKTITITPAAAKPSTISYGNKTLNQGETIYGETSGTATVDRKNNTITLNNFKGDKALVFNAEFTPNSITLIGDSTLSAVETKYQKLTISGSGSLSVGSIKVHNQKTSSDDKPNLTINGATVTVGTAELTTRAIDIDGDLTVTNGSLTATSTSNNVPTVQVGGNATFTGSTVTITNNSTTQGEQYKDSNAASSALHVNGAVTISGGTVTAEAKAGGDAIRAVGNITVSNDATVTAKNNSQYFSAITAGRATGGVVNTLYNLIVSGENTRITATNTHDNNLAYGGAINAYIKNANEGHYLQVGTDTKAIAPNVNTTVRNNSLTITRGDEVTSTNSPVVIAGTTLLNDTYYTITDGSTVVANGSKGNYNAFYDSTTKTLKLNNAQISTTTKNAAIKISEDSTITTITVTGTNELKGNHNHCIESYDNFTINGTGTLNMTNTNSSSSATSVIHCGPGKSLTIAAEVIIKNEAKPGNLIFTVEKDAYSFAEGYNVYASTNVSGSPLEVYNPENYSTYKYLRVTTQTPETGGGSTHEHVWDEAWHDTGDYHHAHQCTICKAYDTTTQESHNVTGHRDNHDGSHSNICGSCGYSAKVSHSYTWAPNANDNEKHIGTCVCGNVVERYHNFVGDVCSDCGYDKSTGTTCEHVWTTEWTIDTVDNEYHWHKCIKCNAITDKKPHAYTIVTDSGTNHIRECECKVFYVEDHISSDWIIDTPATATTAGSMHKECTVCKHKMQTEVIPATGEIVPPTPDNPGTIVIIRPAEEEKPAQQPNPSTGANDLVGLAVAAAVAAALGSAALLRKHD